ncbi:hypothetical protein AYI69_g9770 [Smittium culicis]|uniref:Uncharacterized protein n=1 Tax=Smittium culicis TaxID=133412 RepID=A0A1R1XAD4_9FUNG|nr:hypothetical protein AYI69_g9770 [Smittium culicis]
MPCDRDPVYPTTLVSSFAPAEQMGGCENSKNTRFCWINLQTCLLHLLELYPFQLSVFVASTALEIACDAVECYTISFGLNKGLALLDKTWRAVPGNFDALKTLSILACVICEKRSDRKIRMSPENSMELAVLRLLWS